MGSCALLPATRWLMLDVSGETARRISTIRSTPEIGKRSHAEASCAHAY
ncbi:hypothetical protein HXV84_19420 [Pseudomonas amygdali pv. morsprunorum]|nr:hypothetical protein [Pseudomonas amygdali pv. morsprunorum]